MKVRILAFASAGDAIGANELDLELDPGASLGDVRAHLDREHPDLGPLWSRLAIAVDGEIAPLETPLADGAEIALLPPVSGGKDRVPPFTRLTEAPLDAGELSAAVGGPERGAVVLFLGTVRDHHRGRAVRAITYSAYPSMAERRLATIAAELEAANPELRVAVVHRLGELGPGEASVAIATASPHRAAAYEANRLLLERLKAEVPIWKREHYADGESVWREEEALAAEPAPA